MGAGRAFPWGRGGGPGPLTTQSGSSSVQGLCHPQASGQPSFLPCPWGWETCVLPGEGDRRMRRSEGQSDGQTRGLGVRKP